MRYDTCCIFANSLVEIGLGAQCRSKNLLRTELVNVNDIGMRHLKKGRKLSRVRNQRRALMKTLAHALLSRGKIKTTEAKAKELRPFVEALLTKAKRGGIPEQRMLARRLEPKIVKKAIDEIAPNLKDRPGGYTRIMKIGMRKSDAARMAIIELVK